MTAMPMMGGPGLPDQGMGMGPGMPPMAPPDPLQMIAEMLSAAFQKWSTGEMQIAGEQQMLAQTLGQIVMSQAPSPDQGYVEGAPGNFGMDPTAGYGGGMPMGPEQPIGY